jgi:hypothetical protein
MIVTALLPLLGGVRRGGRTRGTARPDRPARRPQPGVAHARDQAAPAAARAHLVGQEAEHEEDDEGGPDGTQRHEQP